MTTPLRSVHVDRYPVGTSQVSLVECHVEGSDLVLTRQDTGAEYERYHANQWYEARLMQHGKREPIAYFANPASPERTSIRPLVRQTAKVA